MLVFGYFLNPEFCIGLRDYIFLTAEMPVPKTTVDKNYRLVLGQNHIGSPRQALIVLFIPESPSP